MYVSEITEFLQALHAERPHLAAEQAKGRAIWWDKEPQTDEQSEDLRDSRVRQAGYVYQTKI